ncbi:MAG: hypothetical protein ACP5FK_09080 [bacterium]
MIEKIIFDNISLTISIWLILYIADYYLSIIGNKIYHCGAKKYFTFTGSYELTPRFQRDIDNQKIISWNFAKSVLLSVLLILIIWFLYRQQKIPQIILVFTAGGLIVRQIAVIIRHLRNINLFYHAKRNRGLSGNIVYQRWFSYRISAVELVLFAGLFMFIYLLTGSISFLGGTAFTLITATKHYKFSKTTGE